MKHPLREGQHLKRVSLLIQSKKYPGQSFVGHALIHEFNPKQLTFFTSQKFPVDDELDVGVDVFGNKAQMRVLMSNIHEQISSGRVMNSKPGEENPFPVRKFYRCYATITALEGLLPGMSPVAPVKTTLEAVPDAPPVEAPVAETGAPAAEAAPVAEASAPAAEPTPEPKAA